MNQLPSPVARYVAAANAQDAQGLAADAISSLEITA